MGVDHGPLDVIEVGVVLQSPLQEACLLTQLANVGPIIMRKHLISKDGICNLGCVNQVHLQQPRLQMPLSWLIVLQGIQQEGSTLLN